MNNKYNDILDDDDFLKVASTLYHYYKITGKNPYKEESFDCDDFSPLSKLYKKTKKENIITTIIKKLKEIFHRIGGYICLKIRQK